MTERGREPDPGMSVKESAAYMGISRSTLYTLPVRYSKVGSRRVYRRSDLDAYLDITSTRDPIRRAS